MSGRLFVVLALATLLGTACVAAQTLDEILAGNLETRGGPDAFDAVRSARITGTMIMGGESVPVILEMARPGKRRLAFEVQGLWGLQAFDGTQGWQYFPFYGVADPSILPEDELRQFQRETDIVDGPLVRSAEKGYTVELDGRDRIEGTDAFKLRITAADGSVFHSYLDTDHYLEFKRKGTAMVRGRELRYETTIGNYKLVGGIYVPHLVQTGLQGESQVQSMRIEEIELNVEIEDERFSPQSLPPLVPPRGQSVTEQGGR